MLKNSVGESFTVALISVTEKVWIRGREFQDNPSKTFCLTVPNISVGESFTVALLSCIEKIWIRGGGGVSRFSVETFLSLSPEEFCRGILYCCSNAGYRKCLDKKGSIKIFRRKYFVSECRKTP